MPKNQVKNKAKISNTYKVSKFMNNYDTLRIKDSFFYRDTENDYNEFRQLITEYIKENAEDYINFIPEEKLNLSNISELNEEEIINHKKIAV